MSLPWYRALSLTPMAYRLRNRITRRAWDRDFERWERDGRPLPPPHLAKQRVIRDFARRFGLKTLVETGTYYGDMVAAMEGDFERIFSIELSEALHTRAKDQFRNRPEVTLIQGDSAEALRRLVPTLQEPTLFWLDGHYSAGVTARGARDTPVMEELTSILAEGPEAGHVALIDDARCFGTDPAYPTLDEVESRVRTAWPNASVEVADDSIRIASTAEAPHG